MRNTKLTKLRTRRNRSRECFNRLYFAGDSAEGGVTSHGEDDTATGGVTSPDLRVLIDSALDRVTESGKNESGPLRLPDIPMETTLKIGKVIAK